MGKYILLTPVILLLFSSLAFSQKLDVQLSAGVAPAYFGGGGATVSPHISGDFGISFKRWRASAGLTMMSYRQKYSNYYSVLNPQTLGYDRFDHDSKTTLILPSVSIQRGFQISKIALLIGPKIGLAIPSGSKFKEYYADASGIRQRTEKTRIYDLGTIIGISGSVNMDLSKGFYLFGNIQPSLLTLKYSEGTTSEERGIMPVSLGIGWRF